jgi:hypothetical protein
MTIPENCDASAACSLALNGLHYKIYPALIVCEFDFNKKWGRAQTRPAPKLARK